jgi:hypothetical protein
MMPRWTKLTVLGEGSSVDNASHVEGIPGLKHRASGVRISMVAIVTRSATLDGIGGSSGVGRAACAGVRCGLSLEVLSGAGSAATTG